ncbi:hypothetical protein ANACAC_00257 [Anaerostipes caccae L1-92]|uniref:Uncharacterized protein n=1 Tax=Anaerostipes caccae (strain DSM 14662 / CCUG 47493 / JCM 13470 / NCIMB 13811 / L1-92) TaxID=411490 RepID=B0M9N5_ANACD|nr:hypothetical protein ANACAC_00257 [Anaerostipes caccae L1-92]
MFCLFSQETKKRWAERPSYNRSSHELENYIGRLIKTSVYVSFFLLFLP